MGSKYIKDGDDFQFPAEFGFSGSAKGRHDSKNETDVDDDAYGDGSYVDRQRKAMGGAAKIMKPRGRLPGLPKMPMMGHGPAAFAAGGDVGSPMPGQGMQPSGQAPTVKKGQNREPLITMPLSKAQQIGQELIKRGAMAGAKHGAMLGQQIGAKKVMAGMAQAAKAKQMAAQAPTQPQQMKGLLGGTGAPPASGAPPAPGGGAPPAMQGHPGMPPQGRPPMPPPRPGGPPAGGAPMMAHGGRMGKAHGGRIRKADGGEIGEMGPWSLNGSMGGDPSQMAGRSPMGQGSIGTLYGSPEIGTLGGTPPTNIGTLSQPGSGPMPSMSPNMSPSGAVGWNGGRRNMSRPQQMQDPMAAGNAGLPAMAHGGRFISEGIKHPGRMRNLAAEHGRSVHGEMEHDKHSTNPSLRAAANLGLRLTGGDLSRHKKGK